jgi:hypothetical protein
LECACCRNKQRDRGLAVTVAHPPQAQLGLFVLQKQP